MKVNNIRIGTNISGTPTYYRDTGWGVSQIWAKPRYGKTSMLKVLIVRMCQSRPLIAFDFYGDWVGLRDYNWNLNNPHVNPRGYEKDLPMRIENLKVVDNPGFQISDFANDEDWLSWGFPRESARAMADLASCEFAHHDNVETFGEMLADLPTDAMEVQQFKSRYGEDMKVSYVFPASKTSMIVRWQWIQEFFSEARFVKHWGQFMMKHNQIVVNYDLTGNPLEIAKAKAFTGKILSQLKDQVPGKNWSYLQELHPVVVLEEADKLLPPLASDETSSVFNEVMEIGLKLQRTRTALFLITQDPIRLEKDVMRNFHTKIMGRIPRGPTRSPDDDLTAELVWDPGSNYRQFVIIKENGDYEIFVPDFCPCK